MKQLILIFCSAAFALLSSTSAVACWCVGDDPKDTVSSAVKKELRRSVLVFSGVALERSGSEIRFSVEKVWKGSATNQITFDSQIDSSSNSDTEKFVDSCAQQFEVGKKYLVYVYRKNGWLFVSKCSRTQFLESVSGDIVQLDKLVPKAKSRSPLKFSLLNP